MPRRAHNLDGNQPSIVAGLRAWGCSVQSLAGMGDGCPDLLVGRKGSNWLLELKDPAKPPSHRVLTSDQVDWHRSWRGQVAVVHTLREALLVVGIDPGRAVPCATCECETDAGEDCKCPCHRRTGR